MKKCIIQGHIIGIEASEVWKYQQLSRAKEFVEELAIKLTGWQLVPSYINCICSFDREISEMILQNVFDAFLHLTVTGKSQFI